jgi:hypothetical protein
MAVPCRIGSRLMPLVALIITALIAVPFSAFIAVALSTLR